MIFFRKRGNNHYNIYAIAEEYDLYKKEEVQPDEWEPWEFTEDFYSLVSEYYTNNDDENVKVYTKTDDCGSDEEMDIPDHLMSEESDDAQE